MTNSQIDKWLEHAYEITSNFDCKEICNERTLADLQFEISKLPNAQSRSLIHDIEKLISRRPPQTIREIMTFIAAIERLKDEQEKPQTLVQTDDRKTRLTNPLIIILHNIRSAENIGNCVRTAEAFGCERVIFTGYTQDPTFAKVKSTSMGCDEVIPWTFSPNITDVINELKTLKYRVYALETAINAQNITHINLSTHSVFIFGNEKHGLPQSVLSQADDIIKINLVGNKNSLNVAQSVAASIFEYSRQNG